MTRDRGEKRKIDFTHALRKRRRQKQSLLFTTIIFTSIVRIRFTVLALFVVEKLQEMVIQLLIKRNS